MRDQIIFADGTTFDIPAQKAAPVKPMETDRLYRLITVSSTVAAVKAAFTDNATYRHEWESLADEDESGNPVTEVQKEDLSAYSIASDIIDKRDGRIIAVMGKPTEKEELQAALAAAEAAMTEGVNSIVDDE